MWARVASIVALGVAVAACSPTQHHGVGRPTGTTLQQPSTTTGATTTSTTSPTSFQPMGSSFINPEQGWVLGSVGCQSCVGLQVTTDGGSTWAALPALSVPLNVNNPPPNAVTDIYVADRLNGFLFGPGLEITHDGGETWTAAALPPVMEVTGGDGYAFALAEDSSGGVASLWRTTDGSNTWSPLPVPPSSAMPQGSQLIIEGSTLLLLYEGFHGQDETPAQVGALWDSTDGGSQWVPRTVPCMPGDGGAAVVSIAHGHPDAWLVDCFDNEQSSQAQETQHHLYGSANAGRNWVRLADPSTTRDPALLADNGFGHAFLRTDAGGQDWLMATFDDARSWTRLFATVGFTGWADLQFVDASTGFVVAPSNGYANTDHVYRTDDGGRTWRVLRLVASG